MTALQRAVGWVSPQTEPAMNGTSGFQADCEKLSRASHLSRHSCTSRHTNQLLHKRRRRFRKVSCLFFSPLNLIALINRGRKTSVTRIGGTLLVMQLWWPCLGLPSYAQTISLESLEVTQSIQSMSLSTKSYNNTVPMIANKKTVVRAYFSSTGTVALAGGTLKAVPCPAIVGCDIPSVNSTPVTVDSGENGNLRVKRDDITKSLNFELPPHWTRPGTLTLTLDQVAGPNGTAITCTRCKKSPVPVTFRSSSPLRLRLIGLKYERPTGGQSFEPREEDVALVTSWLKRAYPVAEVEQPLPYIVVPYNDTYGDLFLDEDGDGKIDEDAETCMYANRQLQVIRSSELSPLPSIFHPLSRAHYYGLIYDGGPGYPNLIKGCSARIPTNEPDLSTTAAGPTGPAGNVGPSIWAWDTDGSYGDWYAGHELGHTFGRLHLLANGCTTNAESDIDTTVDGRISPNPPSEPYYVGFDSGDRVTLSSGQIITIPRSVLRGDAYDVMTHCNPYKWLNHYTYEGIRERLTVENAPLDVVGLQDGPAAFTHCMREETGNPARLTHCWKYLVTRTDTPGDMPILQGEFLNILGIVNFKKGTGKIDQVDHTKYIVTKPQTPDGRVQVRVTYEDGMAINYPVEIRVSSNTQSDKRTLGLLNTPILFTKNIASVELVMAGKSASEPEKALDTIKVSKQAPIIDEITIPKYNTRAAFFKDPLALTWKGHDEDSKALTYTVQFSSDRRGPWQTLGIGLTKASLELAPRMFEHLHDVNIKVIASDRFNKGEKIVTITIPEE